MGTNVWLQISPMMHFGSFEVYIRQIKYAKVKVKELCTFYTYNEKQTTCTDVTT